MDIVIQKPICVITTSDTALADARVGLCDTGTCGYHTESTVKEQCDRSRG